MFVRILLNTRELLHFLLLGSHLLLQTDDLLGEGWHFWHQVLDDLELPLPLLQLKFEHPHLLFFLTDGLFTVLEDRLLDIRLLVKDAQLIVLVDQLNTHVVSGLTSRFILEDE